MTLYFYSMGPIKHRVSGVIFQRSSSGAIAPVGRQTTRVLHVCRPCKREGTAVSGVCLSVCPSVCFYIIVLTDCTSTHTLDALHCGDASSGVKQASAAVFDTCVRNFLWSYSLRLSCSSSWFRETFPHICVLRVMGWHFGQTFIVLPLCWRGQRITIVLFERFAKNFYACAT